MNHERTAVFSSGRIGLLLCRCGLMAVSGALAVFFCAVPVIGAQDADLPEGVIQQESAYYYTIQKGDTLWGLSRRFAGTPFYWPELWKENSQIPNPHRIFPGERIRLFRRQWSEGPAAPEPEKMPEAAMAPSVFRYPDIEAVGFIRKKPVAPLATVFKLPEDKTISGQFQSVFLLPADGAALLPGQQFTVYRTFDPLWDKTEKGKTFIGYQHYILGVVEITTVSAEAAEAAIVKSFREIRVGDKLMPRPQPLPDSDILLTEGAAGIDGKILQAEENSTFFGDHTVVFLNRGETDGLSMGQQFAVYDPALEHLDPQTKIQASLPAVRLGTVLVLRTEADTATAVVTRSNRDIVPGALIMSRDAQK